VRRLRDLLQDLRDRHRDLERDGARAGNHHVARGHVAELEHIADDFRLFVIERAGHFALVDDELDFVAGDGGRRFGAIALEPAGDDSAQPERRHRERRHDDLERSQESQEPRGPELRGLGRCGLEHLGRDRVADD
jgi:hypothetical protein